MANRTGGKMKPYTRDIELKLLRKGQVLRSKTKDIFYIITEVKTTWLHEHIYIKCIEVSNEVSIYNVFRFYRFKKIKYTKLWLDELTDLEEVVM